MKDAFTEDLLRDIPRGLTSRYLKSQTRPQARWQNPETIMTSKLLAYDPNNPGGKVLIGAMGSRLIGIEDNRHIMTVAGSRAGKSVTVIGNLLCYRGSVLCTDPKGELAEKTAQRRAKLGQKVYVLDPFGQVTGKAAKYRAAYNPLSVLTLSNPCIIEDAVQITDALIIRSEQEKDPHWNESAGNFLLGVILYVATAPDIPQKERHLGTVRRLTTLALECEPGTDTYILPKTILNAAKKLGSMGHIGLAVTIEGSIKGFYEKSPNEMAGVLSTARRHTQFLDFEAMKTVLSGHSFDLANLKRAPKGISVYLCLPATRMGMCNRWLRLFINQLLDAMERERTKPDAPVLVCLDEFPVLGFMSQLQDAAGQIASFDVKLWVIMQDWGQGKALYGERFESFAANAGIFQAFGNVDLTTTEYLSQRLGQTAVEDYQQGDVSQDQRERGVAGRQQTQQLYPLLAPDEIARLFARNDRLKRQLVFWAGYHPMVLQRVEYFDPKSPINHHEYNIHR